MSNVFEQAYRVIVANDPDEKITLMQALHAAWESADLNCADPATVPELIDDPGRPRRPHLVEPSSLPKRNLASLPGRAELVHAIVHIEFNAINLACDAVYRFRGMPCDYYGDWLQVAAEEAYHFDLLRQRLHELGYDYGDFEAHDGLWNMARQTRHDVLERMALVPRVLEAKGLDATPRIVRRLRAQGDTCTIDILENVIYRDEIDHVRIGSRWFEYCCAQRGWDSYATFACLVERYLPGRLRGPFNFEARARAGFSEKELNLLRSVGT